MFYSGEANYVKARYRQEQRKLQKEKNLSCILVSYSNYLVSYLIYNAQALVKENKTKVKTESSLGPLKLGVIFYNTSVIKNKFLLGMWDVWQYICGESSYLMPDM